MLLYREELYEWERRDDINMHITVDGTDDPDWKYNVGFVPQVVEDKAPKADADTFAIVCGPPIMIKFTQPALTKTGVWPGSDHHVSGKQDEVRYRYVRTVQHRKGIGLQRRSCIYPGTDQSDP